MAKLEDNRPDPDALLAGIAREQRGGLKVFLGAAPGVGKTYAMLLAAQEAHREGHDIVIGVVESHGRRETEALCDGIEAISLAGDLSRTSVRGVQSGRGAGTQARHRGHR